MAPPSTGPSFKGSRLVRGPMAGDHYTQIHNLAVRGAIPTRYVGVFGFISSHEEGWHLTAASVATQLEVGVDFVTSALQAIEAAGCLIRGRERDAAGKVRGSVWFITDLPLQLRQLGIEDEALIRARVRAAYETWLAGVGDQGDDADQDAGEPNRENPILAATSGNAAPDESLPRSGPNPGFPVQAEPDQVQPAHKKTKGLEDQGLEEQKPLPPTPRDPAADSAPVERGEEEGESPKDPETQAAEVLEDVFRAARLHRAKWVTGQRGATLTRLLAEKITEGWHPGHLVDALSESFDGVDSVYGVLRYRISELGAPPRRPVPRQAEPADEPYRVVPVDDGQAERLLAAPSAGRAAEIAAARAALAKGSEKFRSAGKPPRGALAELDAALAEVQPTPAPDTVTEPVGAPA